MKFLTRTFWILPLIFCHSLQADLTGRIVDSSGSGLGAARVFAEPGVEKAVVEGEVSADGSFRISGEFFGNVGLFAYAPNHGFSGEHLTLAAGDEPGVLTIRLGEATRLMGHVVDEKGNAIAGARVISAAITHPVKVGIPLSKLEPFGIAVPQSDASGKFQLTGLPRDAQVALKFEHPLYAREAVTDLASNSGHARVVLHRGVSLRGSVLISNTSRPVSGALVIAHNTQPPHDTAATATDGTGAFKLLLKPGVYLLQAHGEGRISPGMQRMDLTGALPEVSMQLMLSETGRITGSVHDAKTGLPLAGARLFLETRGQVGGVARTGPQGLFQLNAPEGSNTVRIETLAGYQSPEPAALQVLVPPAGTLELPGFWLAPVPDYRIRILREEGGAGVGQAVVGLLQPRQFGWQRADGQGALTLQFGAQPADGRLLGFVEDPSRNEGALFSLAPPLAADASVTLLPFGRVSGRVVNSKGQPMPGLVVGSFFADEALEEPLALWRQITDGEGRFDWPWAPAGVPQRCIAALGSLSAPADRDFNPAPGEHLDLGDIKLSSNQIPPYTAAPPWTSLKHQSGTALSSEVGHAVAAFYCTPREAGLYLEALPALAVQLRELGVEVLLAVSGPYTLDNAPVPIYETESAETLTRLYTARGDLFLETPGVPPFNAFRALVEKE